MSQRQQSVVLRGFPPQEAQRAQEALSPLGYRLVQTLTAADLVIVGPEASPQSVELARGQNKKVITWAELQSRLGSATAPRHDPVDSELRPPAEGSPDGVRILDVHLPGVRLSDGRSGRFDSLCFDEPFLRTVRAVALGVAHGLPTALEGPTAASKTTAVLWLAELLGQPVIRMNLNGQTDVGELVGRFVPSREGAEWDLDSLAALGELLHPDTLRLLEGARQEGREMTWGERVIVARKEGIAPSKWHFQEGVIPRALRSGAWVLLDELNLGEPQILERLNPVLENPPTLVLSESDQTTFGPQGIPVHQGFRLLATLNPAEYSGRSVLSPAFRDRWTHWCHATSPGEKEFHQQLRLLVHGEQPEVVVAGGRYQADAREPIYPALAGVDGMNDLLVSLARFHAAVAQASGENPGQVATLGRSRRERYVFSRRILRAAVQLWAGFRENHPSRCPKALLGQVIEVTYLGRLATEPERNAVRGMATAAGLPL